MTIDELTDHAEQMGGRVTRCKPIGTGRAIANEPEPKESAGRGKRKRTTPAIQWVPVSFALSTNEAIVTVPVQVVSEANGRYGNQHWSVRKERADTQKAGVAAVLGQLPRSFQELRHITLVRLYRKPARRQDDDNLSRSFKAIRDVIATWKQVDDGDESLTWEYRQEATDLVGIRIELR